MAITQSWAGDLDRGAVRVEQQTGAAQLQLSEPSRDLQGHLWIKAVFTVILTHHLVISLRARARVGNTMESSAGAEKEEWK